MSFTHAETIDKSIMSGKKYRGRYVDKVQQEGFEHIKGSDELTKASDTHNWLAKFKFDREKMNIAHPNEVKPDSILIEQGNVPNVYEYDRGKLVVVASQSILLLDDFKPVREIKDR